VIADYVTAVRRLATRTVYNRDDMRDAALALCAEAEILADGAVRAAKAVHAEVKAGEKADAAIGRMIAMIDSVIS